MNRASRIVRALLALCGGVLACLIVLARVGIQGPPVAVAAGTGVLAAGAAAAAFVLAAWRLRAPSGRRGRDFGEALGMAGVFLLALAGFANWAFEYRALMVLQEGEQVMLDGAHLDAEASGPLGGRIRPNGSLRLEKVRWVVAEDGFLAESDLRYASPAGGTNELTIVSGRSSARVGGVFLHQGAFGFVPRIVVSHDRKKLYERWTPIHSRFEPGRAVAFEETIDIEPDVTLSVGVSLDRLDEEMKGHPVLGLQLRRGQEVIGAGELLPGHGADLREGWHVGFAGLRRWSEIDIVSEPHRRTALLGASMAVVGGIVFALAAWRRT
jgi:hypothetical protein